MDELIHLVIIQKFKLESAQCYGVATTSRLAENDGSLLQKSPIKETIFCKSANALDLLQDGQDP